MRELVAALLILAVPTVTLVGLALLIDRIRGAR